MEAAELADAHVIARDGVLTSAADAERWRSEQLGWSFTSASVRAAGGGAKAASNHAPSTVGSAATAVSLSSRPAFSAHMAADSSPLASGPFVYTRLEHSEREAAMIRAGKAARLHAAQQAEERARAMARLKPSERRRLREVEERAARFNQFPFTPLADGSPTTASATTAGLTMKALTARF